MRKLLSEIGRWWLISTGKFGEIIKYYSVNRTFWGLHSYVPKVVIIIEHYLFLCLAPPVRSCDNKHYLIQSIPNNHYLHFKMIKKSSIVNTYSLSPMGQGIRMQTCSWSSTIEPIWTTASFGQNNILVHHSRIMSNHLPNWQKFV